MVDEAAEVGERETLFVRGCLDLCVLVLLHREPAHAYGLVKRLVDAGFESSSYGTIYPIVTRLRQQGLLTQRVGASVGGPARNVLSLTPAGDAARVRWAQQWQRSVHRVEDLLEQPGTAVRQETAHAR